MDLAPLRRFFPAPRYVLALDVCAGADAIALDTTEGREDLHAIRIFDSRAAWRAAERLVLPGWASRAWILTPPAAVLDDEVPPAWGHLVGFGDAVLVNRHAPEIPAAGAPAMCRGLATAARTSGVEGYEALLAARDATIERLLRASMAQPAEDVFGQRVRFTVPGAPVPCARARVVRSKKGVVRSFTPEKTAEYKARVRRFGEAALREAWWRTDWAEYGLHITVYRASVEGDCDNFRKGVMDALGGKRRTPKRAAVPPIAWYDDRAITDARDLIVDGDPEPRLEVVMWMRGQQSRDERNRSSRRARSKRS